MTDLAAIAYQVDGEGYTGFLADGSRGHRVPGILVAHEGGGLTDHVKQVAVRLADAGYVAFALDLFGMATFELGHAKAIVAALRADVAMLRRRGEAGLAILRAHPGVDPARLAAIGYCFGGTAAIELARGGAELACVVGFHAGLTTAPTDDTRRMRCPVLLCLGSADPIVTADQRAAFVAAAEEAGIDCQVHLYAGVGHSFTNREIDAWKIPGFAYDAVAERRSWQAMQTLFGEVFAEGAE